jgi:hypothetical protein
MKKIIRVDIFKGVFAKTPVDTLYQIIKIKKEKENAK